MTGGGPRRPLGRAVAPLRHRSFALFWTGAFVSNVGTWMETVAIGVYVTEVTGQATWTGLAAAAGFVPTAILGPVGGALADRWERRRILLVATLVQTAIATTLAVLFATGAPAPAVVTLLVLGGGCAMAIGFPAFQALLPDLVPREELMSAVALSSAQWNLGRVIGPLLAGIVIGVGGFDWALGVNAVSFLAVVAVLLVLRLPPPEPGVPEPLFAAIRTGLRFVRRDPGLRVVVRAMSLNTLLAAPFIALVPAMAIEVLDAGATGTSVLVTAQGVGAVAMGLSMGALAERFGARRTMVLLLSTLPGALVVYALSPTLLVAAPALFLVGALYLGALSSFTTVAQLRAPGALRGRVMSVNNVILGSLYPLGAVVQGWLADRVGLRTTTAGAALLMGGALLVARAVRPGWSEALDSDVDPAALSAVVAAAGTSALAPPTPAPPAPTPGPGGRVG